MALSRAVILQLPPQIEDNGRSRDGIVGRVVYIPKGDSICGYQMVKSKVLYISRSRRPSPVLEQCIFRGATPSQGQAVEEA
jgi:hypothetical protein